ncbi:hypothetical protein GCM10009527_068350 [Actinomadura nitritigenes]
MHEIPRAVLPQTGIQSRQLVQMLAGVEREPERAPDRPDHLRGGIALAPLLEAGVVIGADSGEDGDLLTAKAVDATP